MRAGTLQKRNSVCVSYCENPLRICIPALRAIRMVVLYTWNLCRARVAMSQTMPQWKEIHSRSQNWNGELINLLGELFLD